MTEGGAVLHVKVHGREIEIDDPRPLTIGRDPMCDIHVDDDRVSRKHAVLRPAAVGWELEDVGSTNGTFCDGQQLSRLTITRSATVLLGSPEDGATLDLSLSGGPDPRSTVVVKPDMPRPRAPRPRPPGIGRMSSINRMVHNLDWDDDETDGGGPSSGTS